LQTWTFEGPDRGGKEINPKRRGCKDLGDLPHDPAAGGHARVSTRLLCQSVEFVGELLPYRVETKRKVPLAALKLTEPGLSVDTQCSKPPPVSATDQVFETVHRHRPHLVCDECLTKVVTTRDNLSRNEPHSAPKHIARRCPVGHNPESSQSGGAKHGRLGSVVLDEVRDAKEALPTSVRNWVPEAFRALKFPCPVASEPSAEVRSVGEQFVCHCMSERRAIHKLYCSNQRTPVQFLERQASPVTIVRLMIDTE
jgi:hypothetical protein